MHSLRPDAAAAEASGAGQPRIAPAMTASSISTSAPVTIKRLVRVVMDPTVARNAIVTVMGELRLTAIGVEALGTLFSGSPAIEEHLRGVAAAAYPPEVTPRRRGLLGKVGPITVVPDGAPIVKPGVPTNQDLHDVTHGRFVKADRLTAAWTLVRLWLDACGWPSLALDLDEAHMNDLDFELATGGVETRYALRRLLNDKLSLPLRTAPGQVTGYVDFDHARALRDAWRPALDTLSPHNRAVALHVVGWLGGLESWASYARPAGQPLPDLIASYTQPTASQA
ncbi:MAG TPA: hypothetical protein PKG79_11245 [Propioniciclava tarda]|nr:hypothetical protein [Propioniciclava tarda]